MEKMEDNEGGVECNVERSKHNRTYRREVPQSVPPTAARGLSQVSTLDSLMDALAASASLSSWQSCCRKVPKREESRDKIKICMENMTNNC